MYVNFEFLGNEPIENVITAMHYKIDKTIFFGYQEIIDKHKKNVEGFLKKYCNVKDVEFHLLSHDNMQSVLQVMRSVIRTELEQDNQIFFDITGGESLILVAFGMLSKEFELPMHFYQVEKNVLVELDEGSEKNISTDAISQKIKWNLDRYIELYGGVINYQRQKEMKDEKDSDFNTDISGIWRVVKKQEQYWNSFSAFLREYFEPNEDMKTYKGTQEILTALQNSNNSLNTPKKLKEILCDLEREGILKDVKCQNGAYSFMYKNKRIQECLWDGGSILELYLYQQLKLQSDECRIGVHIDWDGVVHSKMGVDVLNEIDILTLNGNIPTFISCKSGKMGEKQALYALYELETVAERFGGKYAKKMLMTMKPMADVYYTRAHEMGIEVKVIGIDEKEIRLLTNSGSI